MAPKRTEDINIHIAAMDGDVASIQRWLDEGLFVDKRDNLERTLLHQAAWSGRLEVVRLLLGSYAVVDARDKDQCTPLHYAAQAGQVELVKELLKFKAAVDPQDLKKETPLFKACMLGHPDVAEVLLTAGADPRIREIDGKMAGEEINTKVSPEARARVEAAVGAKMESYAEALRAREAAEMADSAHRKASKAKRNASPACCVVA